MPWNNLTRTLALAIDNDQDELNRVMELTNKAQAEHSASSWRQEPVMPTPPSGPFVMIPQTTKTMLLAGRLKERYSPKLLALCNPEHTRFFPHAAGMLLNEALGQIDWQALAQHYLEKHTELVEQ